MGEASGLVQRIDAILALEPVAGAVEQNGQWHTWGALEQTSAAVAELITPGQRVGVILRNRAVHVGLLLGVLRGGGCVVTINPGRGVERTREDIAGLGAIAIAGEPRDIAELVEPGSTAVVTAAELGVPLSVVDPALAATDGARPHDRNDSVAVQMLTSGTTGPPKRVDLSYETLERVLVGAKHYEARVADALQLRKGVAVVNSPLVHLGGLFRVLQCVTDGRSFALLERFTVEGWVDAVRRHRPATASLVPAALRMVLEADLDPADLASIRSVVSGTAPLAPDDADAFKQKYRIPVLVSYAATEFGGGVAGWNLADHEAHWADKRGSVGRAHPGCELRVVDPDSGSPLPPTQEGLLEVKANQLGDDSSWIRTTDLARIDADGFLWILGRADQAIIRGGFKVLPDSVKAAIETHPFVRGAAVIGIDDRRLGAVPVALVELRDGPDTPSAEDLRAFLQGRLAAYEVPTEVCIVDHLPRTDSGKIDLGAVRAAWE